MSPSTLCFSMSFNPSTRFSSCAFYSSKQAGGWLAFLCSRRPYLCCTILHSLGTLLFTNRVLRTACLAPIPHSRAHLPCLSDTVLRPPHHSKALWLWPAWIADCWVAAPTVWYGEAGESLRCALEGAASPGEFRLWLVIALRCNLPWCQGNVMARCTSMWLGFCVCMWWGAGDSRRL